MFRKYGHGHSVGVGVLLTLAMERHALLAAVLIFAAGLIAGRAWATWALWASALRDKWHLSRPARIRTRPEPVYDAQLGPDDDLPF